MILGLNSEWLSEEDERRKAVWLIKWKLSASETTAVSSNEKEQRHKWLIKWKLTEETQTPSNLSSAQSSWLTKSLKCFHNLWYFTYCLCHFYSSYNCCHGSILKPQSYFRHFACKTQNDADLYFENLNIINVGLFVFLQTLIIPDLSNGFIWYCNL